MFGVSTMSSHIKKFRSFIRQLAEVKYMVEEEDAKAILLNIVPSEYNNINHISSHTLEDMISSLLVEEKRAIA